MRNVESIYCLPFLALTLVFTKEGGRKGNTAPPTSEIDQEHQEKKKRARRSLHNVSKGISLGKRGGVMPTRATANTLPLFGL